MNSAALQEFYRGFYITTPQGNNAFSYDQRVNKKIYVPPLIKGSIDDVQRGDEIVFSEIVVGSSEACAAGQDPVMAEQNVCGLKNFVHIERPGQDIFIFDNHNHAFSCWAAGVQEGVISSGATLVHVDQHKDTREPEKWFDANGISQSGELRDEGLARLEPPSCRRQVEGGEAGRGGEQQEPLWRTLPLRSSPFCSDQLISLFHYANYLLNVGNFIPPAVKLGWFNEVVQVGSLDAFETCTAPGVVQVVLDIDLDIFAPVMDHIPEAVKIACLRQCIARARFVTIATSPFFMDQNRALHYLRRLL